jgi:hypothetical protein
MAGSTRDEFNGELSAPLTALQKFCNALKTQTLLPLAMWIEPTSQTWEGSDPNSLVFPWWASGSAAETNSWSIHTPEFRLRIAGLDFARICRTLLSDSASPLAGICVSINLA